MGHRGEFRALNVACAQSRKKCTGLNGRELFRQPSLHQSGSILLGQNVPSQQLLKELGPGR
jgi:hypothetical protein